jgi:hypothetical protein
MPQKYCKAIIPAKRCLDGFLMPAAVPGLPIANAMKPDHHACTTQMNKCTKPQAMPGIYQGRTKKNLKSLQHISLLRRP